MNETAMAPSPTPDATRLTEPGVRHQRQECPQQRAHVMIPTPLSGPSAGERRRSPTCCARRGIGDSHRVPPGNLAVSAMIRTSRVRAHHPDLGGCATVAIRRNPRDVKLSGVLSIATMAEKDASARRRAANGVERYTGLSSARDEFASISPPRFWARRSSPSM